MGKTAQQWDFPLKPSDIHGNDSVCRFHCEWRHCHRAETRRGTKCEAENKGRETLSMLSPASFSLRRRNRNELQYIQCRHRGRCSCRLHSFSRRYLSSGGASLTAAQLHRQNGLCYTVLAVEEHQWLSVLDAQGVGIKAPFMIFRKIELTRQCRVAFRGFKGPFQGSMDKITRPMEPNISRMLQKWPILDVRFWNCVEIANMWL